MNTYCPHCKKKMIFEEEDYDTDNPTLWYICCPCKIHVGIKKIEDEEVLRHFSDEE